MPSQPIQDHELQLLSAERLAELLDISVRTLWRMRSAGKLPAPLRVGSQARWSTATIRAWLAAGCPIPDAPKAKSR